MNPSAFPIPFDDRPGAYCAEPGMHLRDYFAAKAMQGFAAEGGMPGPAAAKAAYEWADAMLRERESSLQSRPRPKGPARHLPKTPNV